MQKIPKFKILLKEFDVSRSITHWMRLRIHITPTRHWQIFVDVKSFQYENLTFAYLV